MNTLTRYNGVDPFREMRQAMNAFWNRDLAPFDELDGLLDPARMAVDVTSNDKQVIVRAELPGVKESDIDVKVEAGVLTITAETKYEHEDKDETYHRREMRYGKIQRSVALPDEVNADKAEATLDNGVLTISLPRLHEGRAKQIAVKARDLLKGRNN